MTIEELIEDAVVDALAPALPDVIVESSPDEPALWDTRGAKGCCLVRYFGSSDTLKGPRTMRSAEVHVYVGSKSHRGTGAHRGSLQMMAAARDAMNGAAVAIPDNERPVWFYPAGDRFFREQNGVWWYILRFRTTEFRSP